MTTETIDRLFLELSQVTSAKTKRELELECTAKASLAFQEQAVKERDEVREDLTTLLRYMDEIYRLEADCSVAEAKEIAGQTLSEFNARCVNPGACLATISTAGVKHRSGPDQDDGGAPIPVRGLEPQATPAQSKVE